MFRFALVCSGLLLASVASAEPKQLTWDELVPFNGDALMSLDGPQKGPDTYVPPHDESSFDGELFPESPVYPMNVVEHLDGQEVRLPGYIVPLDLDSAGNVTEFFLVPYVGACVHLPPPPPNQIVYVIPDTALRLETMWETFWIEGTMSTEQHASDIGLAGYTIRASKIEDFTGW